MKPQGICLLEDAEIVYPDGRTRKASIWQHTSGARSIYATVLDSDGDIAAFLGLVPQWNVMTYEGRVVSQGMSPTDENGDELDETEKQWYPELRDMLWRNPNLSEDELVAHFQISPSVLQMWLQRVRVGKEQTMFERKIFVGVIGFRYIRCVACANEHFGFAVVKEVGKCGSQGHVFEAVYLGDKDGYDGWLCVDCGKRLMEIAR